MVKVMRLVDFTLALAVSSDESLAAGPVLGNVLSSTMLGNTPCVGCGAHYFQSGRQYQR